jgi:hypothetical protein
MSFVGTAFDHAGFMLQDLTDYYPTDFSTHPFQCGVPVEGLDGTKTFPGPGSDIKVYFSKNSGR